MVGVLTQNKHFDVVVGGERERREHLLFRGVEITTGGQRIHDHAKMVANIEKWGLDPEKFSYYLQAFKHGMPPHGGSATGIERLTQKLLGIENVKETTLFPRDINRIDKLLTEVEGSED